MYSSHFSSNVAMRQSLFNNNQPQEDKQRAEDQITYHHEGTKLLLRKAKTKNKCWQGCGETGNPVGRNVKWYSCYGK